MQDEALFYQFSLDESRSLQLRAESIIRKPFRELSLHADLPRFQLQLGDDAVLSAPAPKRVGAFLAALGQLAGDETIGNSLREFSEQCATIDALPDRMHVHLIKFDSMQPTLMLQAMKCCCQGAIAPYFVFLKQQSRHLGRMTSVADSWRVSVGALGHLLTIAHCRSDRAADYRMDWTVLFCFSKLDASLKQITPMITKFEGKENARTRMTNLFERMRVVTQ